MSQTALEKDVCGTTVAGAPVERYTLRNAHGAAARILTLGATVTELWMPDARGQLADRRPLPHREDDER